MLNKYFIVLVFLVIYVLYKTWSKNSEHFSDNDKLKVSRPWVNLYDNNNNILNVLLLSRPFFQSNDEDDYKNKILGKFNNV